MRNRIMLFAVLLLVVFIGSYQYRANATARTVSHDVVTTYTDGSPIEPGNGVTYSVWMQDNVTKVISQISNRVPVTAHTFDDSALVKGRVYNYWGAAHLLTGQSSDNSAIFAWTLPLGKASPPAGWAVQ